MTERRPVQGLGEIALRVADLDTMQDFYQHVVGLELLRRFPGSAFFRVAEGVAGLTQILALFDRTAEPDYRGLDAGLTTIDHLAFGIALEDYAPEVERLRGLGLDVTTTTHAWVHWRSLYVDDPEGNQVELVCFDPRL